jgi:hypothetical protein
MRCYFDRFERNLADAALFVIFLSLRRLSIPRSVFYSFDRELNNRSHHNNRYS